jgi:serine/threonine protein kinase
VVNLLEVIEKPRHIYLVTEFVAGGELFEFIVAHGRLQETQACRIFRQVLVAVDACHALGVAHRDLKPENMLIDDECNIKLIDFGLSNTFENASSLLRTACGSPCYAAPEMIAGRRYLGAAADFWSLGVCLFAMVRRNPPATRTLTSPQRPPPCCSHRRVLFAPPSFFGGGAAPRRPTRPSPSCIFPPLDSLVSLTHPRVHLPYLAALRLPPL